MKLSVIICTHNPREEFLRRTLEALRNQTLPMEQWELLLIDNASSVSLATQWDLSWHPLGRHLHEPKLGKMNAWLLGMREARAEILMFVDDDNVLDRDYLEQALAVGVEWPFVGAWGGSVIPEYEHPLPAWVGGQVWRLTAFEVTEDVWSNLREGYLTLPVGAGMCVRRNVASRYLERCRNNPNRALLDRSGKGLGGYGDIDLSHCAMDLGLGAGKSKRLRLTHLIPAGRLTLDYFVRHAEGDAVSMTVFRASRGLPITKPKTMNWFGRLRWFLHRVKNRVPREQYEIARAHQRGMQAGWELAQRLFPQAPPSTKKSL